MATIDQDASPASTDDWPFDVNEEPAETMVVAPVATENTVQWKSPWGVPLAAIRSALFSVVASGRRRMLNDVVIYSNREHGDRILYSGQQLNQYDAIVWQHALLLAKRSGRKIGEMVEFNGKEFLAAIGLANAGGSDLLRLTETFTRLTKTTLEVVNPRISVTGVRLISIFVKANADNNTRFAFSLSAALYPLLTENVALDIRRKAALGKSQLARWLHDYLSTQRNGQWHFRIEELMRLSGYGTDREDSPADNSKTLSEFKRKLHNAFKAIAALPDDQRLIDDVPGFDNAGVAHVHIVGSSPVCLADSSVHRADNPGRKRAPQRLGGGLAL